MLEKNIWLIIFPIFPCISANYQVILKSDGPIVKGGTINFEVTVYDGSEIATDESFKYDWEDNGIPQHMRETGIQNATDSWSVAYNASIYPAGPYLAQVTVIKCILYVLCKEIGSSRIRFDITGTLNGDLQMQQNNVSVTDNFVSNKETVMHIIDLKKSDSDYISKAPTVLSYWFVDCMYYGITTDFKFPFNYTTPDQNHMVEALVMADFTPLPPTTTVPPPTTTTTAKPNNTTTTKPNSTTKKPLSTTPLSPNTTTTTVPKASTLGPLQLTTNHLDSTPSRSISKRNVESKSADANVTSRITVQINGKVVPYNYTFPYVCNGTLVATDPLKSYGYFYKKLEVKAPLSKVNVTGNNWIQPGNLLSLHVTCSGSKNIEYCVAYKKGEYNITGNETCLIYTPIDTCAFEIKRFLSSPKNTIIIVIKNEVSKVVTPVTVNIYEVNKQGQLSVIVVPVAFSLVAVVLIVFGVAYYMQNRSRFIIEVADFNFGQQYSDMEYKTFRERLRDSIANGFMRDPSPSTSEVPVWPPGQKYGSMT